MNSKRKILCYGDSNTWGYIPGSGGDRFPEAKVWPSLLQKRLDDDYVVINEGLNSRTTNIDDPDKPDRNGLASLKGILNKYEPIDVVILFLGTNDLKSKFNREPEDIANGIEEIINLIRQKCEPNPEIILLCPPIVNEKIESTKEKYQGAEAKSKALPALYKALARKYGLRYINLQDHIKPSDKDGYHLDKAAHEEIAEILGNNIDLY